MSSKNNPPSVFKRLQKYKFNISMSYTWFYFNKILHASSVEQFRSANSNPIFFFSLLLLLLLLVSFQSHHNFHANTSLQRTLCVVLSLTGNFVLHKENVPSEIVVCLPFWPVNKNYSYQIILHKHTHRLFHSFFNLMK